MVFVENSDNEKQMYENLSKSVDKLEPIGNIKSSKSGPTLSSSSYDLPEIKLRSRSFDSKSPGNSISLEDITSRSITPATQNLILRQRRLSESEISQNNANDLKYLNLPNLLNKRRTLPPLKFNQSNFDIKSSINGNNRNIADKYYKRWRINNGKIRRNKKTNEIIEEEGKQSTSHSLSIKGTYYKVRSRKNF